MRQPSRVLVTGGAGFLGTHLCEWLLRAGARVVCVDDLCTSAAANVSDLQGWPGLDFIEHDITEPPTDQRLRGPFDIVFHLASPASPPDYMKLPVQTLKVGSQGTTVALDIAERCGARFVLASTSEVYGDPLAHPQPESYWGNVNPIGPRSVYDEAKRFAEALVFAHHRSRGADVAVARIFNTYGPRMRPDDGRMVPTFCRQALQGEPITVAGSGHQTRSLCHVDDTVAALLALAASDITGPVNIGNPTELTVLRVAELIRAHAGSTSPIHYVPAAQDDPQRRCPDIRVAREQLGWEPKVGAEEGLAETVDWFRTQIVPPVAV
ncbi:UDP-glucuronic acid decarboxylase family protein [Mycobacterium noviomagense]|uniref:Epimerase n=1 Tax=Mycobacterium noviomagense TaxID=459858 RepID=A0A7I7PH95_9MYCO|nr:UDP-glucuronic acid decarboxylase family protein [Mycobacterium noviomagense]ORB14132.1 epimerase [Mycobacterium noviomagense]BBY07919.1 dTDP-glucose 4,6-dehydratase [Mycobacterium noviomagense]